MLISRDLPVQTVNDRLAARPAVQGLRNVCYVRLLLTPDHMAAGDRERRRVRPRHPRATIMGVPALTAHPLLRGGNE